MIIVKLQGGLGNQMFQYAFARNVSTKIGQDFALDLSGLDTPLWVAKREYRLEEVFGIRARIATPIESEAYKIEQIQPIYSAIKKIVGMNIPHYIKEHFYSFQPKVFDVKDDAYFDGNWQSEKYFADSSEEIRDVFSKFSQLSPNAEKIKMLMSGDSNISLHVRRGDYVTNADASKVLGTCSTGYYKEAIDRAMNDLKDPTIFVFSDDTPWVRSTLDLPMNTVFISEMELQDWEEMRLITFCRRHIVSNSSFSWWGAWLDPRPDKMVIAPKTWFRDTRFESPDIVPQSWIRI